MGRRRFAVLLRGLSGDAVWRHVLANAPRVVSGDEAVAVLKRL